LPHWSDFALSAQGAQKEKANAKLTAKIYFHDVATLYFGALLLAISGA
jgi:hypothetical protein